MGMFDSLDIENDIEEAKDTVGGFSKVDHTGFYKMKIEKAYAGMSSGGAFSVTIHMKSDKGALFTITEYITSGTAKGCKNYYLDKSGKKQYLPGYNKIKALDSLLTGSTAPYPTTEKKNLMIWDRDASKELPVEKEAVTAWFGKEIGVLVMKSMEDKYNDEATSVDKYEVQHFLDGTTNQTRNEKTLGESGFKDKWVVANPEDKVIDKRKQSKNPSANEATDMEGNSPF